MVLEHCGVPQPAVEHDPQIAQDAQGECGESNGEGEEADEIEDDQDGDEQYNADVYHHCGGVHPTNMVLEHCGVPQLAVADDPRIAQDAEGECGESSGQEEEADEDEDGQDGDEQCLSLIHI